MFVCLLHVMVFVNVFLLDIHMFLLILMTCQLDQGSSLRTRITLLTASSIMSISLQIRRYFFLAGKIFLFSYILM